MISILMDKMCLLPAGKINIPVGTISNFNISGMFSKPTGVICIPAGMICIHAGMTCINTGMICKLAKSATR